MIHDPLYSDIETALSKRLDDAVFEQCAVSLLRHLFPALVPVSGGHDAGMDGHAGFADGPPVILVATTGEDALRNLRKNLKSHVASGGKARLALFATTESLTGRRRLNLEKETDRLGFSLIEIYDRAWFVEALYGAPDWRKALLGLTGEAPALSLFPPSRRPKVPLPLVGREHELEELRNNNTDVAVVGKPGIGKTAVLRHLAAEGWGLFVVDGRDDRIPDAIRKQKPRRIILDDAHFESARLTRLRHLRDEIAGDFRIVAVTWPGGLEEVEQHLGSSCSIEVGALIRDDILEVVRCVGVKGPTEFQRSIVDQSMGRPGLAATLALLALNGKTRDVATGEALLQDTRVAYRELLGDQSAAVLAVIALAGDAGVEVDAIATALRLDLAATYRLVTGLASGGTIDERRGAPRRLIVQPESLRYALVREVFFGGAGSLPLKRMLEAFDDPTIAIIPLVGATYRGAKVDPGTIQSLVGRSREPRAVAAYAGLGETETEFALSVAPGFALEIARSALYRAPQVAFRVLMERAVGDDRSRHSNTDHPLRVIGDHLADPSTPLEHRRELLRVVARWQSDDRDYDVGLEALCCVLRPGYRSGTVDPGSGNTWTMREGILPIENLREVGRLWKRALELISVDRCRKYDPLFDVLHDWVYPGTVALRPDPDEKSYRVTRRKAGKIIRELADRFRNHRGIVSRLARITRAGRLTLKMRPDAEFETFFPPERIKEASHWRAVERRQLEAAHLMAESMIGLPAREVTQRIVLAEREAAEAGITWPRMTIPVCEYLAQHAATPEEYVFAFLAVDASADLIMPFLSSLAKARRGGWSRLMSNFLGQDRYWRATVVVCLTHPVGKDLREEAIGRCDESLANWLEALVIREELDDEALGGLLEHKNPLVARAVAMQLGKRGTKLLADTRKKWERAIVRCSADDYWYAQIMSSQGSLLVEWVEGWLDRETSPKATYEVIPKSLLQTIGKLPAASRLKLLNDVAQRPAKDYIVDDLVASLVGEDDEVAGALFKRPGLRRYQGAALVGRPTGPWLKRASMAMDNGWTPKAVVAACTGTFLTWSGPESAYWDGWVKDYRKLGRGHRAKRLSEAGVNHYSALRDIAARREREEAVHGWRAR